MAESSDGYSVPESTTTRPKLVIKVSHSQEGVLADMAKAMLDGLRVWVSANAVYCEPQVNIEPAQIESSDQKEPDAVD